MISLLIDENRELGWGGEEKENKGEEEKKRESNRKETLNT